MSWVLALLQLLVVSQTVVGQCDYIYVAEPPAGQLICDPFPINQLQLVCSIFVAGIDVNRPETLTIQWFFSAPVNRQFNPANAVLLQEVSFRVVPQETFTSRIVVSSPPIGFYYCQPDLTIDQRPLIISNVAALQPPFFYQQRNIRPCLVNEFQNSSEPFCVLQGVPLGPNQVIAPAPANINDVDVQFITPTVVNIVTPTALLTLVPQATSAVVQANVENVNNAGLVAGVVIAVIAIVAIALVAIIGLVVFFMIWKKKNDSKFPRTVNSRYISEEQRYAAPPVNPTVQQIADVFDDQEASLIPPSKPPPRLRGFTNNRTTDQQYNRLIRSKAGKSSNSSRESENSAYYITPDNDDRVPYYGKFDEELTKDPYIDESESLVYTDSHYSAESDIHLQQQRKQQEFVRSSSLDLQSDEEGHRAREAAGVLNAVNRVPHSRHNYENCVPQGKYDNAVLSHTPEDVTESTPYYQEIIATRELKTGYTSADMLESTSA